MKLRRYFLMSTVIGILVVMVISAAQVFAIGIKTSSSGCKAVNENLSNSTNLKVEDNGKTVVVASSYYFDKDDEILLEWSAVDNNGQYLKSTGGLVLPNGGVSATEKIGTNSALIKVTGSTNVSIKITVADTSNLKSISYKVRCESAYFRSILYMPEPLQNPFGGFSTLPTLTPLPPLPTLAPLPTRSP